MGTKLNGMIDAAKGEIGKILLEEAAPAIVVEMVKGTTIECIGSAAGTVIPGVGNMMLSYKQKRLERNFELYVSKIVEKQDEINERLSKLEESHKEKIQGTFFGLVADYASQAKQAEKIDFIVNGFVNITGGVLMQEDSVMMYYDTLEQLTVLDLRILKLYMGFMRTHADDDNISKIMDDYQLDNYQIVMIKEKLERLGLLQSRNDLDMDENIKNMAKYLEDFAKGKKNAKLKKLNKISKSESYKITSYGRKFFKFFCEA